MTNNQKKAAVALVLALVVGAVAQSIVNREAALLGLSMAELALIGLAVGSFVQRSVSS